MNSGIQTPWGFSTNGHLGSVGWQIRLSIDEVEAIGKGNGHNDATDDGPPENHLVMAAVATSHARQEVVTMFFFVFRLPKHSPLSVIDWLLVLRQ
jgi:hypothetical protein